MKKPNKMIPKINIKYLIIIILSCLTFNQSILAREVITLKYGWIYSKGPNDKALQVEFDDSKWLNVAIPHDWAISGPFILDGDGNTGKLPWKGEGWYRKQLEIPSGYEGKQVYLLLDGVMVFPEIYVNGNLAGKWDYGYNSFYLNITEFLKPGGKNVLVVHVDTQKHDCRWYQGAGIYRKVQMIVVEPVHVGIWKTSITTPIV
jgi:beta-galactosidase